MSQRTTLVAGAVAAAAWWFKKRQSDERRDRSSSIAYDDEDALFRAMKNDAVAAATREPWMAGILQHIIQARSFEDAVATVLVHKLAYETTNKQEMRRKFREALLAVSATCRADAEAVVARDPAADGVLDVVMYYKGFSAIQGYRIAHRAWQSGERSFALWLQSRCSQQFGVDIHPAAVIGPAVIIDHATGVVIGETAVIGEGCTLLHGVTLGGSGKDHGDRHPKIGKHVLLGAGCSVLGNIRVGDRAKIGAGSIVLKPIPSGATAVGAPANRPGRRGKPRGAGLGRRRGLGVRVERAHEARRAHAAEHDQLPVVQNIVSPLERRRGGHRGALLRTGRQPGRLHYRNGVPGELRPLLGPAVRRSQ